MGKIPEQAKKVFTGKIFDVYQWEQEMFDGSTATFEMLKRVDTVEVIAITEDDKILLTRQEQPGKPPFIGLPGGRNDQNETPEECAKRELLEETGFTTDNLELFKSYNPTSKIDWTVYIYIAKNCKKIKELNLDAGEKIEVSEVGFEEFVEIVMSDDFHDYELKMDIMKMMINGKIEELRKLLS